MILNCCRDDWANFSYDNHLAMQAVGIDSVCVKLKRHDYEYENQAQVVTVSTLKELINQADIVQVFHSDKWMHQYLEGKKVIVYHAGSTYRMHHAYYNHLWRNADLHVVCLGEFWKLAPKNKRYLVGAMEMDWHYSNCHYPLEIAHYPSNPEVKGTNHIINMLSDISSDKYYFLCDTNEVDYRQQLNRLKTCDIYIEMFKMQLGQNIYGSFGITALEAAAMGKIVVTNNLHKELYQDVYGDCALQIVNTEQEFKNKINQLINLSTHELRELQNKTKQWALKHSYLETGKRIKSLITEIS